MKKFFNKAFLAAGAAGLGAGLAYLFDAQNGKRRRARMRDRGLHFLRKAVREVDKIVADLGGRSQALVPTFKHILKFEIVDDRVLMERVRSKLGHYVSHPHSLKVETHGGVVTLRGPIPASEVNGLLSHLRRISGVKAVKSRLEPLSACPRSWNSELPIESGTGGGAAVSTSGMPPEPP